MFCLLLSSTTLHAEPQSLSEAMHVFGMGTIAARDLATQGERARYTIDQAISGLQQALDAADWVLQKNGCEPALLPTKVKRMTAVEREAYLPPFTARMQAYRDGLKDYQQMFIELKEMPLETRDYSALRTKDRELELIVNDSHANL
jgi:hypothetical protein